MRSVAKKIRKKSQREAARVKRQGAPGLVSEDEDPEVHFRPLPGVSTVVASSLPDKSGRSRLWTSAGHGREPNRQAKCPELRQ